MKIVEIMKRTIWMASMLLFLGLLLFVFYHSMSDWNAAPFFLESFLPSQRKLLALPGILVLFFLFFSIGQIIWKKEEKQLKRAAFLLFSVYVLFQIVYLLAMQVGLRYDALKTLDEAVSVCKTGTVSDTHLDGYFARYTNNYPILFLTIELLKLFRVLGIAGEQYQNAVTLLGLVNIAMIDIGIFFGWKLAGKIKGEKMAFLCLLFSLCNPVFLIWTPFYYTNTVSMGFLMAGLYGIYRLFGEENRHLGIGKECLTAFLCAMALWAGCSIRATVFITVIAAAAYFLLKEVRRKDAAIGRYNKKQIPALKFLFLFLGVLFMVFAGKWEERKYISFDSRDTAFPPVHWIAMGAGGQGVYNIVDEYYTIGFETKEEKITGDIALLKERIGQLGTAGYGRLMLDKLRLTWSEGSGGYLSELGVSQSYLSVHKYFLGSKSDFMGVYGAVFYSFSLAVTAVSTFLCIWKKKMDFLYVVKLNLLGGFLFHMLWEAGTIYSIGFMLLLPLSMIEGFAYLEEITRERMVKKGKYLCLVPAAGIILLLILKNQAFFRQNYITNEATVNQFLYQCDEQELLMENVLYIQSFQGDKKFNRLGIQVKNESGESNSAVYHVMLLDDKKKVLAEQNIQGGEISGYQFVTLSFDEVDGKSGEGCYYVVVEKTEGKKEDGLTFLSYDTGNYDAYRKGTLIVRNGMSGNDFLQEKAEVEETSSNLRDLAFCVYQQEEAPYFGR
ncbi:MAG: hypothetical protein HDR01_07250 [Lachnospiraceae bacterium]|nr:hypothetical protein [Lachnospiraceae bacterium]